MDPLKPRQKADLLGRVFAEKLTQRENGVAMTSRQARSGMMTEFGAGVRSLVDKISEVEVSLAVRDLPRHRAPDRILNEI